LLITLPAFGLTGPNPQNSYDTDYNVSFLDSFLLKMNINQCIITGNSRGGGIAWNYTADHPEKVNKLIGEELKKETQEILNADPELFSTKSGEFIIEMA
jgi:pimeloyl-ACP methyl ester carboxylesterase